MYPFEGTERGSLTSRYSRTPTQALRKFSRVTHSYVFSMKWVFYELNENEFRGRSFNTYWNIKRNNIGHYEFVLVYIWLMRIATTKHFLQEIWHLKRIYLPSADNVPLDLFNLILHWSIKFTLIWNEIYFMYDEFIIFLSVFTKIVNYI